MADEDGGLGTSNHAVWAKRSFGPFDASAGDECAALMPAVVKLVENLPDEVYERLPRRPPTCEI